MKRGRIAKHIHVDGSVKQTIETSHSRLLFVGSFIVLSYLALTLRLFTLAITGEEGIKPRSMPEFADLRVERGAVVDRSGILLSTNLKTASIYANPKDILDVNEAATKLKKIFPSLSKGELREKLSSEKGFVWIKRNLPPKDQYIVNNLGLPGLYFKEEEKRVYPHSNLFSHVIGMVGLDGHGLSGMEKAFDDHLLSEHTSAQPLQLSLDVRVQDVLYHELKKAMGVFKAKGASGIVLDANSSEVVGLVSLPDFDPNAPSEVRPDATFNRATYGVYEMGSTFKTFTLAQALDQKTISLKDGYDATKPIKFANHTIRDSHAKERWLSVPEIFMYSSNIGTARIAIDIGRESQRKFMTKLGLLDKMDFELPERGTPIYPDTWRMINTMTIAYGHGIAVTPLHLANAMAAMVNGGVMRPVTFLKRSKEDMERLKTTQIISNNTSKTMRKLLRLVVGEGTGSKADAKGYLVGGKTGTAEKIIDRKYARGALLSSFVGAFPMTKPKYVVLVIMDEPKGNESTFFQATGGYTAAPVVSQVISRIAPILGIMPVDEESAEIRKAFNVDYKLRRPELAAF